MVTFVDQDRNGLLTYEELVTALSKIHASYVLHKVKMAIEGSKTLKLDTIFASIDRDGNNSMDIMEFNSMISDFYTELKSHEIN